MSSKKRVELIDESVVFDRAIFRVVAGTLRHERYDGTMSDEMVRLNLDRGDSVAALVHDVDDDVILLTEQFRYPVLHDGPGWIVEIPAGMIDGGEEPELAIRREVHEEIGYEVDTLRHVGSFYMSPGGSSERIHCYYARVDSRHCVADGGGDDREGEDIRIVRMPVQEFLERQADMRLPDAKTMIMAQWFAMNQDRL